MMMMNFGIILI